MKFPSKTSFTMGFQYRVTILGAGTRYPLYLFLFKEKRKRMLLLSGLLAKLSKLAFFASFDNLFIKLLLTNFTHRTEHIAKLLSYKDKDFIKVVSGLRRSGKSTLLELYKNQSVKSRKIML